MPKMSLVVHFSLSLLPSIPYLFLTVNDIDSWYGLFVNILKQVYPNLAYTASTCCLLIVVDMYTKTFLSMCKVIKDNTLSTKEVINTIQAYRTIKASIGPILLGCSSIGIVLLTAIVYVLAVKGTPELMIYVLLEFVYLFSLAD